MAKGRKIKKKYRKFKKFAIDIGAEFIDAIDEFGEVIEVGKKAFWDGTINVCAAIIVGLDNLLILIDRLFLHIKYKIGNFINKLFFMVKRNMREIVVYFSGLIVLSILLLSFLNVFTGYEYSYKGRVLGVVKNQEDVVKIVDLVSEGLSKEYGTNISISVEDDISFSRVYALSKDMDNIDTVLKRLSNMSDTRSEAYTINVNGEPLVYMESKKSAYNVLNKVISDYVKPKDRKKYEKVGFVENITVDKSETIVGNIKGEELAYRLIKGGNRDAVTYTFKEEDSIIKVCEDAKISIDKLKELNPGIDIEDIKVGDRILIAEPVPSLTVQTVGLKVYGEKIPFKTKYEKSSDMYEGDSETTQKGVDGKKSVTARITTRNGKEFRRQILKESITKKPIDKIVVEGSTPRPPTVGSGSFSWPTDARYVSGYFGYESGHYSSFHSGIDIAGMGYGSSIYAADGGTVVTAGVYGGYGNCVIIDHQNGYQTLYGHNSSLDVSVGDKVYKGQRIAGAGSTGFSFAVHCHFEIMYNGSNVDPLSYL